jgi:two-component system sensor histidine kinase BaeS
VTTSAQPPYPTGVQAAPSLVDWVFGTLWPDRPTARPRLVLAAVGVGALAALVVPDRNLGLGTFLVFVAVAAVVVATDRRMRTAGRIGSLALCLLLGAVVVVRDAEWVVVLCVLAALAVAAATLVEVRSFTGLAVAAVSVPLAGLRGLPWIGRSIVAGRPGTTSWAVVRTAVLCVLVATVFGSLLASADALVGSWLGAVVPTLSADTIVARIFVLCAVAGATLAFAYVSLNPPRVVPLPAPRPVTRTFEWLLPVGIVIGLFGVFLVAQLAVMFGGHDYVARTTGVTYADYVHQGFTQLCVATVLTLGLVAAAAAKARRDSVRDRTVLRVVLGILCALTLVLVASALDRMHVYEEAYGFTRLRLLVTLFEGWLGLLVVLVMVAGIRLRGPWLPMATVLTGAVALLGLAWLNPDAYIASQNIDRYQQTGKVDTAYLAGLSADAAPELSRLPESIAACVQAHVTHDDWLEWNLGRHRAAGVLPSGSDCRRPARLTR